MWSPCISCESLSTHVWAQEVRKKFSTWCRSSNSRRTDTVTIKQGLPSHQPITPEEPRPEEHQRILYPDIRPARQQCWARNSKGTEILKQQGQIYLSTSHTQVCVRPQPARWCAKLWAHVVWVWDLPHRAVAEHSFNQRGHLGRKVRLSMDKDGSQSSHKSQK